jgi:threonine dehydrogenase-like Zn-dependent dehydrogenase
MKAVAVLGKKDIRVVDVAKPAAGTDGLVVRMRASGICGSDLHVAYNTDRLTAAATRLIDGYRIIGHEFAGEVAEVGSEVTRWKVGDRVVVLHGRGGMAEYVHVPANRLDGVFAIPDGMPYASAATVEPLSNAMHFFNVRPLQDGETVALFGCGVIGLGYLQVAKALRQVRVLAVDVSPLRLDVARRLGADAAINAAETDPVRAIKALTGEHPSSYLPQSAGGCDLAVDCAGKSAAFSQALEVLKPFGGAVILAALYEDNLSFDPSPVVFKHVAIYGTVSYSNDEGAEALRLIASGQAPRDLLVTHTFPLERAPEAFEAQCDVQSSIKVMMVNE